MLYRPYDDNWVNAVRGIRGMKSATRGGIGHQLTFGSHSELNHRNEVTVNISCHINTGSCEYRWLNNKDWTRIKINLTTVNFCGSHKSLAKVDMIYIKSILFASILCTTVLCINHLFGKQHEPSESSLVYMKLDLIHCIRTGLFARSPRLSKLKFWHCQEDTCLLILISFNFDKCTGIILTRVNLLTNLL